MDLRNWIPMRWRCGPLDVEQDERRDGFTAADADVLREWAKPAALDRLRGMPVNCLVVTWARGTGGDEEQRRALAPLVAAARERGLAVVGWVSGSGDLKPAAQAAQAAGFAAIATESKDELPGTVLRFGPRGVGERGPRPFVGDADAVWPGMKMPMYGRGAGAADTGGADAQTGPTNSPWIDSNAWYVRLARTLLAPQAMWLAFDPPELKFPLATFAYVQAIADGEVFGGRWMISLDARLRRGLSEGQSSAVETWRSIGRTLAFFRRHEAWAAFGPAGQLGVLSDYSGPHEFMAFEMLNLLARQSSLYQIVDRRGDVAAALGELDAVVYTDDERPTAELLKSLHAYAEQGGTLITPPGWEARGVPVEDHWTPRFRVLRLGKGRLAISRQDFEGPQELAEDAQLLMSHRRDRVRVFNPGIGLWHYATSPDGRAGVLHSFQYPLPYAAQPTSVWFRRPWAAGHVFTTASDAAVEARRAPADPGVEFHLPPTSVYSATEVTA